MQEITPEALSLRNLTELTQDVIIMARSNPELGSVLAQLTAERSITSSPDHDEGPALALLDTLAQSTQEGLSNGSKNMIDSIANTQKGPKFRQVVQELHQNLNLPPEEQRQVITTHFEETLTKATAINQALASLTQKSDSTQ